MIVGITFSTLGMLWLTQLGEHSGYLSLVGPLLVFGLGNGLAFVPLTSAALEGVDPKDAGAASGLVNVMQQLGGSLGLAVLVTVFGSASSSARADLPAGLSPAEAARRVYVHAADTSFWAATAFLAATWLLVTFVMRRPKADRPDAGRPVIRRPRSRRPAPTPVEEPQLVGLLDCPASSRLGEGCGRPTTTTLPDVGAGSEQGRRRPRLAADVLGAEAEHGVVPDLGVRRGQHPVVLAGELQEPVRQVAGGPSQRLTRSHHRRSASLTGTR